jgi:DNA polymerase I-like protein with 3'-5' exonuclease and polymerase domains
MSVQFRRIKFQHKRTEKDFPLYRFPQSTDWADQKRRLLIVVETVESTDIKYNTVMSGESILGRVLSTIIPWAQTEAKIITGKQRDYGIALINFNNRRTFTLSKPEQQTAAAEFAVRVNAYISEHKPTHVFVCGDTAAEHLMPGVSVTNYKRGWVHDVKMGGVRVKCVSTLDIDSIYSKAKRNESDEDNDYEEFADVYGSANLIGYIARNLTNLFVGYLPYSLEHIKPKFKYVKTLSEFDHLYEKLVSAKSLGYDTETRNLSCTQNSVYTMQFAFEDNLGFVLPYKHPTTPFSSKDRSYIAKRLTEFWRTKSGVLTDIVMMNGAFDLRVTRAEFGIPLIHHTVWEATAGEVVLDENIKFLMDYGTYPTSMLSIFTSYGNDWYHHAAFSKQDRANIGNVRCDDPDFLAYASMDVQSLVGIKRMQIERAKRVAHEGGTYAPVFRRYMRKQMSSTVHVVSHMKHRGVHVDMLWLAYLKSKNSPLLDEIKKLTNEIADTKEVKTVNKRLARDAGVIKNGLFGNQGNWVFSPNKPDHKIALFFDVMGLPVVSTSRKTNKPNINRAFFAANRDNQVVSMFERLGKLQKLVSTYVVGWWNKLKTSEDNTEPKLRPDYGFTTVVTGRLNSFDPSLQQTPTRGKEAKYIKRMFVAPYGHLQIVFDYSANEVRGWSMLSNDFVLAGLFRVGQRLRQKWRKNPVKRIADKLKKQGDIHIANVKFFFGKWVDKEHELRFAIKAVVFGVIYGKSAATLAKDVKKDKSFAQDLIDRLFNRFKRGAEFLEKCKSDALEKWYVTTPTGRRRNLPAVITGVPAIIGAMMRRAMNSPIQGFASEFSVQACRLIALRFYEYLEQWHPEEYETCSLLPTEIIKFVHDALYSEVPYRHVLPFLHILQYTATYGVAEYYEKEFDFPFTIEPEIEIEVGASEDNHHGWDWSDDSLRQAIEKSLDDQLQIHYLKRKKTDGTWVDTTKEQALSEIYKAYANKPLKKWLETKYPILGLLPDGSTVSGAFNRNKNREK